MKNFKKRFAVGVIVFFLAVSLIFRERNIYTQSAWVLFIMTCAVNTSCQCKDKLETGKYIASILFYTMILILGLGQGIIT